MSVVWSILIVAFSVWMASLILPGIKIKTFWDSIVISIIFSIVNFLFAKLLFAVIGVATLGLGFVFAFLTRLVVTGLLLKLTDVMTERLEIHNFKWALGGALVITVLSAVIEKVLPMIPGLPGI